MLFLKILTILVCTRTAFASDPKVVLIGHAANFSDVSQSAINPYNRAVTNGLEFAVEKNLDKLKAKKLEIRIQNFDYGNKETSALSTARDIIDSSVVAVIGFYESSQSLLAAPELQKARIPLISPVASATRLFQIGPYIHPMSFSNQDMGVALARLADKKVKAKNALIISAADCAYCSDLANAFEKEARLLKIKIDRVEVLNEDASFEKVDQIVMGKRYDAVVVPNYELSSAKIVSHLMKAGINTVFLGGDGWGNAAGSGFFQIVTDKNFIGYCVAHWHPEMANSMGKTFIRQWKAKFGSVPTMDSAMAFDSMNRLIEAILKSKAPDRENIQNALASNRIYEGVTGTAKYSGTSSSLEKPMVFLKSDVRNKKFVLLKTLR